MSCPTLFGYVSFLTSVAGVEMENLPSFAGLGTLIEGSNELTITAVTAGTGNLVQWASVTDTLGAIPANTVIGANPPLGPGTYLLSQAATSTQSTPEAITGTNQWIVATFCVALETVNEYLALEGHVYAFAVYNLATDRLLNWAPDIENQTYFQDLRRDFKIARPALGVATTASDQGTSGSVLNPTFMRELTAADLQTLKTPFGREYIGLAQQFGSTLFGVT